MANSARIRMAYHPTSRVGVAEWVTGPLVSLLVMSWPRRLACVGGMAVALMGVVALAGHVLNGWSPHLWGSSRLPASAFERAPLFTAAWAAHDELAMKRFVLATDEAKLHAWVAATPVPAPVTAIQPSDRTVKTVSVQRDDTDGAILNIRISDRSAAQNDPAGSGGFTQRQLWSYSGGNWYFSPEAPAAVPAERMVAINPANRPAAPAANTRSSQSDSDDTDRPTRAPTSSGNVIIPTMVPPWARAR
jgi:hypothetical protein